MRTSDCDVRPTLSLWKWIYFISNSQSFLLTYHLQFLCLSVPYHGH